MKVLWHHPLALGDECDVADLEGPVVVVEDRVWFATFEYEHPAADRAANPQRRGKLLHLASVHRSTGDVDRYGLAVPRTLIPADWSAVGDAHLYCGSVIRLSDDPELLTAVGFLEARPPRVGRLDPVVHGTRWVASDRVAGAVRSFDLAAGTLLWSREFGPLEPYGIGEVERFGDSIVCHADGGLHELDPWTGDTIRVVQLPRADVLYSPRHIGDDTLYGYTNWSTGGVVRCDPAGAVRWKYSGRFDGPASYRRIWVVDDAVVWVKGETELVGIDLSTGEERWTFRADRYLAGPVTARADGTLVVGTSGRTGAVHLLEAASGHVRWEQPTSGNAGHRAEHEGTVIIGDLEGELRRIDVESGDVVDRLDLGRAIVGDIQVADDGVYTVLWPTDTSPARLVAVDLGA